MCGTWGQTGMDTERSLWDNDFNQSDETKITNSPDVHVLPLSRITEPRLIRNYLKLFVQNRTNTTLTNFSTRYLMICKVYTGVGGIK